jgi:hypothetical protein
MSSASTKKTVPDHPLFRQISDTTFTTNAPKKDGQLCFAAPVVDLWQLTLHTVRHVDLPQRVQASPGITRMRSVVPEYGCCRYT